LEKCTHITAQTISGELSKKTRIKKKKRIKAKKIVLWKKGEFLLTAKMRWQIFHFIQINIS